MAQTKAARPSGPLPHTARQYGLLAQVAKYYQRRFAEEIRRVGKRYWVQTPNRFFLVEQHLLLPVIHLLPHAWQRAIVPRWTGWDWLEHPTPDRREFYLDHYLNDVRLLGRRQLESLFPDARIMPDRWPGLSKSLVAWRAG